MLWLERKAEKEMPTSCGCLATECGGVPLEEPAWLQRMTELNLSLLGSSFVGSNHKDNTFGTIFTEAFIFRCSMM